METVSPLAGVVNNDRGNPPEPGPLWQRYVNSYASRNTGVCRVPALLQYAESGGGGQDSGR